MNTLNITNFTDPMMGLSYESEPFLRRLETHFEGRICIKYAMAGLVRNVFDFVDPEDLKKGNDFALTRYNARLAKIYESEENISGMPISMPHLRLFSTEHTSSIPLNLGYKAAQLIDSTKADLFLYNLRYATIVECKPTTKFGEILSVAQQTLIDRNRFIEHYTDGSAQVALDEDFLLLQKLGVRGLPAYYFEYSGRSLLVGGVMDYSAFLKAIAKVTRGELTEAPPYVSFEAVKALVRRRPLISPIEIKEAFGLRDIGEVERLIHPLLEDGAISVSEVPHGWFIQKKVNHESYAITDSAP